MELISCKVEVLFSRMWSHPNHQPLYGTVSPISRIHRSRNQEVDPLTITPVTSLRNFCFQPYNFRLGGSGDPGCQRKNASTRMRYSRISSKLEAIGCCWSLQNPNAKRQTEKERLTTRPK